jgi:hypothetical protein
VTVWSVAFINRKHGAWVLLLLSIMLWLVGGGFAPIFMSILAFATATKINKSMKWWRAHLPINFLAKFWPWSLMAFVLVFFISVEIAIFGYPLLWLFEAYVTYTIQSTLAFIMVGLMLISIITAFTHDIKKLTLRNAKLLISQFPSMTPKRDWQRSQL